MRQYRLKNAPQKHIKKIRGKLSKNDPKMGPMVAHKTSKKGVKKRLKMRPGRGSVEAELGEAFLGGGSVGAELFWGYF